MTYNNHFLNEFLNKQRFLVCVLVNSSRPSYEIPSIGEFVVSEIVNGIVSYVSGDAGEVIFQDQRLEARHFPQNIWNYLQRQDLSGLDPVVKSSIEQLFNPVWESPTGPGRNELKTEFDYYFREMPNPICPSFGESIYRLPSVIIGNGNARCLKNYFSKQGARNVAGISQAMKPFLLDDLKFIKETYHW